MQQSAERAEIRRAGSSSLTWEAAADAASSFASTLAELASPERKFGVASEATPPQRRTPSSSSSLWTSDDLADDVATLSCEHSHLGLDEAPIADQPAPLPHFDSHSGHALPLNTSLNTQAAIPQPPSRSIREPEREDAHDSPPAADRNLKCESITIRLSKAESAQLRRRAAQAGLTVSAYLRSCTFEAESLRALVKDTLAQLRSSQEKQPASTPARRTFAGWLAQLWPRTRMSRRAARA